MMGVRSLAFAALGLVACLEPQLTLCNDGRACPRGDVCDEVHHGCATPDQLAACAGAADLTPCTTNLITGICFDQVCLTPGCGNLVVEPGEECDDGNHVSGDGCSADCKSDERCGNGVVDSARGELCDDGNLASHDGCDSQCQPETVTWRSYAEGINTEAPNAAAFDRARQRLVYTMGKTIWEWDGQMWSVPYYSDPDPSRTWQLMAYDTDRERIVVVGGGYAGAFSIADWDGTNLTLLPTDTPPNYQLALAIYDPLRHALLVIAGNMGTYLNMTTLKWQPTTTLPFFASLQTVATFDETRQRIVLVGAFDNKTWEWDGNTWTSTATAPPVTGPYSLAYDGSRGKVVDIGGALTGTIYAWSGTAWSSTGVVVNHTTPIAWYDPTRNSLWVSGGGCGNPTCPSVVEVSGTTVTDRSPGAGGALSTYDAIHDRVVGLDRNATTWAWDGSWQVIPTTSHPAFTALLAFDPVRGHVMAFDGMLWQLADDWQQLPISAPPFTGARVMTYDYGARRLVVTTTSAGTFGLSSDATSWTMIAAGGGFDPLFYDRSTQRVVAVGNGHFADLMSDHWEGSLSVGDGYWGIGSLARGSIVAAPLAGVIGEKMWERRGDTLTSLGLFPATGATDMYGFQRPAVERSRGRSLMVVLDGDANGNGAAAYFLELQYRSALPDESCNPGEDLDSDGLAGCADPDCWQTCGPACPYASPCP